MVIDKKILTLCGISVGIVVIFFGLLAKDNDNDRSIIMSNNILENFYISNRNLEDPIFIEFNDLTDIQILSMRSEYIKREILKREALAWGLDKVDPLILSRLAQLGEQTVINNLLDDDISNEDLMTFYNENKYLYIEDPRITFSHIFFRKNHDNILDSLIQFSQSQDMVFFKNFLSSKVSMFPYQKNYSQKNNSFISGHFSENTANTIFGLSPDEKWQGPIESPFGYHLIKVVSLSKEIQKNYEESKELVFAKVKEKKRKENLKMELEKRISQYKIIEK